MQRGNNDFQKRANMALVMKTVFNEGPLSRADIARKLGFIRSTVSNLVQELLDLGVVIETDLSPSSSKGGRKGILLEVNGNASVVAGLEFRLNDYSLVLINLKGEMVHSVTALFPEGTTDFPSKFRFLLQESRKAAKDLAAPLVGIGASLSGVVDSRKNIILSSYENKLEQFSVEDEIPELDGLPVVLENDARACAWGELWKYPKKEDATFYYLLIRKKQYDPCPVTVAVGLGIAVKGKINYGTNYASGEVSGEYRKNLYFKYEEFFKALIKGDATTEELETRFESVLENLDSIISVLDPSRVYLGNELKGREDQFAALLTKRSSAANPYGTAFEVTPSSFGKYEAAQGAALRFLEELYTIPQVGDSGKDNLTWQNLFKSE